MNKYNTKSCSFVLLVCFVFGLYTLFHSTLTLSLPSRCSILKLQKYGTLMEKIRGILSDYGTLINCRNMGLVGFWDCTIRLFIFVHFGTAPNRITNGTLNSKSIWILNCTNLQTNSSVNRTVRKHKREKSGFRTIDRF